MSTNLSKSDRKDDSLKSTRSVYPIITNQLNLLLNLVKFLG